LGVGSWVADLSRLPLDPHLGFVRAECARIDRVVQMRAEPGMDAGNLADGGSDSPGDRRPGAFGTAPSRARAAASCRSTICPIFPRWNGLPRGPSCGNLMGCICHFDAGRPLVGRSRGRGNEATVPKYPKRSTPGQHKSAHADAGPLEPFVEGANLAPVPAMPRV
jgi:hypothetical protein